MSLRHYVDERNARFSQVTRKMLARIVLAWAMTAFVVVVASLYGH